MTSENNKKQDGAYFSPDSTERRLENLGARLKEIHKDEEKAEFLDKNLKNNDGNSLGMAMRAGSELIAGVLVGGFIGYFLDKQFSVSPLFLILFLVMGMIAGFWNLYRFAVRSSGAENRSDKNP